MNWLTIRNFGRVRYFNLSYLVLIGVPIIAETYELLYRLDTGSTISLTFPPTLKLLYIASIFYALAIAIYQYFCPTIIKVYETEEDYLEAKQEIYERIYPDLKYNIVLTNLDGTQEEIKQEIIDTKARYRQTMGDEKRLLKEELEQRLDLVYPGCVSRHLAHEYEKAQNRYRAAIYLSGVLYLLGTGLLVYLLVMKTITVITT